ncbi:MAG: metal ABC transporter ATP-binding protein [Finegoldia sp.]|nr:metal ABC transporter ATP-binding protein [Finegoldia sp.]
MSRIIEVKDLSFGYNDNLILEDANLQVQKGDFLGLIGPNGSGKSTLIKLILGIYKPSFGSISINDKDSLDRRSSDIGYVPQSNHEDTIAFPITVKEVVSLNILDRKKKANNEIKNVLSMVGLQDKEDYNYNTMSGGEQERVLIAKALVNEPNILIFDEPTTGLDQESKINLFESLKHLNKFHKITIFVVTHDLEFSEKYFSRIVKIQDKKLVEVK